MAPDLISILGSSHWLDNLLVCALDDDLLLALNDRELAIVKAHVIRQIISSPEIEKLIKGKATEIARRLRERQPKPS